MLVIILMNIIIISIQSLTHNLFINDNNTSWIFIMYSIIIEDTPKITDMVIWNGWRFTRTGSGVHADSTQEGYSHFTANHSTACGPWDNCVVWWMGCVQSNHIPAKCLWPQHCQPLPPVCYTWWSTHTNQRLNLTGIEWRLNSKECVDAMSTNYQATSINLCIGRGMGELQDSV